MSDQSTTIAELRQLVASFVAERDWNQFHSPKNLSMSLAIEAAELMEHFQWLTIDQSRAVASDAAKLGRSEPTNLPTCCAMPWPWQTNSRSMSPAPSARKW